MASCLLSSWFGGGRRGRLRVGGRCVCVCGGGGSSHKPSSFWIKDREIVTHMILHTLRLDHHNGIGTVSFEILYSCMLIRLNTPNTEACLVLNL